MKYNEITDIIADKFDEHLDRLITIMHVLNLLKYCVEQSIYAENEVEIFYLNEMLCKYVTETRAHFYDLEKSLNIPN